MTGRLRFAVAGNPIAHSRSPEIHQTFALQFGIDLSYERLLVPIGGFAAAADRFFGDGGSGMNVTVPFKQDAARWVDVLDPTAAAVGAVNTIYAGGAGADLPVWHGANTDGVGLLADLERLRWPVQGQRVLLLGAGGAARGALHALLQASPAAVVVANRTQATAQRLVTDLTGVAPQVALRAEAPAALAAGFDLLINATSLGLSADASAFAELLPLLALERTRCYDMVYGEETAFLRFAAGRGAAATADGFGMLVGQAAVAFERWHGVLPSLEATLKALRAQ